MILPFFNRSLPPFIGLSLVLSASRIPAEPFWQDVNPVMPTKWTRNVKPDNALPEYPRPQMVRSDWLTLNGTWEYALGKKDDTTPVTAFPGKILVPFSYDSVLSGVTKMLTIDQRLWYHRTFAVPSAWNGKRILLHFGAVSWDTTVFLNGKEIGSHQGDYDGFDFDITDALKADGPQDLVVSVWDPVQAGIQPRGKQSNGSYSIWHTGSSGIWQTVWIEPVPQASIAGLKMTPDIDKGVLNLTVTGQGTGNGDTVEAVATADGQEIGRISGPVGSELTLPVADAKLWSPDHPFLYDLKVGLNHGGQPADSVVSYFGMRKIALAKDAKGVPRIWLNNKIMFQIGVLDQGYWPDGLYTAPTDDALRYDIEMAKKFGFNFDRKHVKVEPDRWYYWCDKLGLLVWQDMPNGPGNQNSSDVRITDAGAAIFEKELKAMIDGRGNHPSIVVWVLFNESWGQYDTVRLTDWLKKYDPSRLVNSDSGWTDFKSGDIHDRHDYSPIPIAPPQDGVRASVIGECGGTYADLMKTIWPRIEADGLCGVVYTQLTDIESETSSTLLSYDRILKIDPKIVAEANRGVPSTDAAAPSNEK